MILGSRRDRGASAVEYGLLLAGIAAVIAVGILIFGTVVKGQAEDNCGTVVGYMKHGAQDAGCAEDD
jgi:pilus assembly protein Flp/PilA